MSKIVVNFNFPDLTVTAYNAILAESEPLRKTRYPGLLFHVAAPNKNGMYICDIWESEAHFNAFGEMIMPLLVKAGGTAAPPTIMPLHNVINDLNK
jgi:hypothetical protein